MKITLTNKSFQKLFYYTKLADQEISGLGIAKQIKNDILVEDIFLFEQKSSFTNTELDQKAVSDFLFDWIKKGRDSKKINVWWHSHCDIETFWSSTDEKNIESLNNNNWLLSIVTNKKGDWKTRLDIYQPFRLTFDDLKTNILPIKETQMIKRFQQEIDMKVKKPFLFNFFKKKKKKSKKQYDFSVL